MDAHLETFLKELNEHVIKVNEIMPHTKCKLSHCAHTHNKERFERSRIFFGIKIQSRVREKGAAP